MKTKYQLTEIWLKASIIGTVWASSEIVLGSFLHNLKVPFSGSILTAIAVIMLISVSYKWPDKGLFWRAGLLCAILKTMSPSAVIFGPMIAIFTESVLMEISVRSFGKNYFGFVIGAVLAVSWSFMQKIINFLIIYGFNIVELYKNIMKFTEKQLHLQFDTLWLPVLLLLLVYVLVGFIAAITGIKIGKNLKSNPMQYHPKLYTTWQQYSKPSSDNQFRYSISWLIANILLITASVLIISLTHYIVWSLWVIAVVILWIIKYKRALRQLSKPRFWIFFVLITMLTALVFTRLQAKPVLDALLIGIEMNFRATVLILGFSVLGTELYNPKLRTFFSKTYFKQLPLALELSAESLPLVIANIPDFKTFMRNPVSVISQLIAYSEYRFAHLKQGQNKAGQIIIVTGIVDSGKTTLIKNIINELESKNLRVAGIYSEKVFENNLRAGYNVVDITTRNQEVFLRKSNSHYTIAVGNYTINPDAVAFGTTILNTDIHRTANLLIIDEIGKLELNNQGWAAGLEDILSKQHNNLLLVVRENCIDDILAKFGIINYQMYYLDATNANTIKDRIIKHII